MLRIVQHDFARLQTYLADYSLGPGLGSKAREELLKRAHKSALAALQVWAVMESQGISGNFGLAGTGVPGNGEQFAQISECFSDLTGALFASLHGLYKPAHMSLRSAVETFVRGVAGITSAEAAATTSVYRLFELAAEQTPFKGLGAPHFASLHQQYAQLCLFTHTATPAHMARSFALANYPRHDTPKFKEVVRRSESIIVDILSVLTLGNKDLYLHVPPRARDLLDEVIPATVRLVALGGR